MSARPQHDANMHLIAQYNGRSFYSDHLAMPFHLQPPFADVFFPCLIWDHTGEMPVAAKSGVARTLLKAGCRYAVCGGMECEAWHDIFDEVHIAHTLGLPTDEADRDLVMTTWHTAESPDDVAFFFVLNTNFGPHDFERFLVLHVGTGRQQQDVEQAVRRYALG